MHVLQFDTARRHAIEINVMILNTALAVHVTTVILSIGLFLIRGVWMLRESPRLRWRSVRILPHVNDTLLLLSAIWLTVLTHQYPVQQSWLTAKVVALAAYIGLGMIALRWGRTRPTRLGAWLGAIAVFLYIVAVAVTRNPQPWLA